MMVRAALYTRVSSQEQIEGYSLDAQERAGRAYAAAHDWELTTTYRDEGKSARTENLAKRPSFQQMLEDAEAGRFDVLIVHKLDRFARNLRVTLEMLERLERAGVGFVSISEQMDFTTPIGKVILATLAAFAQYYSDNLSTETKKGKAERKRQGLWNGVLPYGTTVGAAGIPILDTREWACNVATRATLSHGEGLQLAYQLARAGHSDREIARRLTVQGYRTTGNRGQNAFTKDTVRHILTNRFYLGELPDDGGSLPGKHQPLIAPAVFDAVQAQRAINRTGIQPLTRHRSPWALSGIARCGRCGAAMHSSGPYARCHTRIQGGSCDQPSARIDVLVDQLGNGLAAFTNLMERDIRYYERLVAFSVGVTDRTMVAERSHLERRRDRLRELYLEGDLDRGAFRREREQLDARLATLPETDPATQRQTRSLLDTLGEIGTLWRSGTPAQQNLLARQVFVATEIDAGRVVSIVPQPVFRPFYAQDPEPNGSGSVHLRKRRALLSGLHGHPGLAIAVDWTYQRHESPQYQPTLTIGQVMRIRMHYPDWSLRELAVQFRCSHETIRKARLTHRS